MPDESLQAVMNVEEVVKIPIAIDLATWHGRSIAMEQTAGEITVTDDDEEQAAIAYLSKVKAFGREVKDAENLHISPFQKYVNRIKDMFAPISGSALKAEATIKPKILAYGQEKERIAAAERARVERDRQETLRIAREKAAAEHREPTKEELTLPLMPAPVKVQKTVKAGTATATIRKSWKAKIVDPKAVLKGISEGRIPIEVVEFNMKWFNDQARTVKKAQTADGIEFFEEQSLAAS